MLYPVDYTENTFSTIFQLRNVIESRRKTRGTFVILFLFFFLLNLFSFFRLLDVTLTMMLTVI